MTTTGTKQLAIGLLILSLAMLSPVSGQAEWFGDVHIGTAFTHKSDVDATTVGGALTTYRDVGFDKSFEIGGRVGYWFEPARPMPMNFGLGLNVFRFNPDITSQTVPGDSLNSFTEINVTAVSLDLMMRLPLMVDREYPIGRLRPYATLGPAVFWTTIKDGNFNGASATDSSLGMKFGLGLACAIRPHVDLFGEYRYTHFSIDAKTVENAGGGTSRLEMDINTSHLLAGLAFRF